MNLFSPLFFQALITGALILTAMGALLLIVLLILDLKNKKVW